MTEDTSMEFDMFEDVRRKLTEVFMRSGHTRIEAERIALYIVQGVRDVPKFLTILLVEDQAVDEAKILQALQAVLNNANALEKARNILHGGRENPEETIH